MHYSIKFIILIATVILIQNDIKAQDKPIIYYEGSSTVGNFIKDAELAYNKVEFRLKTDTESAGGEIAILEGTADIGGVAKVPNPQVLGKGVVSTLIGWDAIAIVVHKNNPIKNLTKDQLKGIFTNKIKNWNEIGGPDIEINPYIVNEESATRNVFRSRILGQDNYINCQVVAPDNEISNRVASDEGGIGQISFSFLNENNDLIRLLSINGQKATVNNQSYPITRPLYILYWPGRQLTADFAAWTQTEVAQKIITKRFIGKTQETVEKNGKLIVFTKTISVEEGGTYFYPHESYEIYSKNGEFIQYINNRLEPTDENPSIVTLEPNQYLIWTETAKKNNGSKILVNIDADAATRVSVDAKNILALKADDPNSNTNNQLNLYGDFRFRLEQDWNSLRQNNTYRSDRGRARYRLRFGFNYKLNDNIIFGGRLRSGDPSNTQSPHITLGSESSNHTISIDRAYASFSLSDWWISLGKNNLPFWKENEMWWDDDITPDGAALGGEIGHFKNIKIKPTIGYFLLNNLGRQINENAHLIASQVKLEIQFKAATLHLASGLYDYSALSDKNDITTTHTLDYRLVNSLIELNLKTKIPISFGIDNFLNLKKYNSDSLITNTNLENEKIGYVFSFKAGSLNKKGNFLFSYYYAHIPKYAVVDYLAQDDWVRWDLGNAAGTRSSNFKGHELRLAYSFGRGINVVARSYFVKAIKKETLDQKALETSNRFRIDCNIKF